MSVTINGTSGVTTPGISNSEGYSGDGLTIAAGAPANALSIGLSGNVGLNSGAVNTVSNGMAINNPSAGTYPGLELQINGSTQFYVNATNGASYLTSVGTNPMVFGVNGSERSRINASGNLLINSVSDIDANAFLSIKGSGTKYSAALSAQVVTSAYQITFWNPNGFAGSITTTGSATAYNTSSDYRLKDNIEPMVGALEKIAALKPCTFTWVTDGSVDRGFIAHELQEVIPQAVSGEKDAVDDKGNIRPQGVDYGKITPELVAAIQELKARIEILEAK